MRESAASRSSVRRAPCAAISRRYRRSYAAHSRSVEARFASWTVAALGASSGNQTSYQSSTACRDFGTARGG